jgi:hypothetical protein
MIQEFFTNNTFTLIQWIFIAIGYLMPIPLAYIALNLWHHYRQDRFISGIKWVLLEVQVPRDIAKSPVAMELIISNAFYHQSMKGFWEQFVIGAPWLWFSLEIASVDGRVHFFIRTPSRIRDLVETQIYAQYPQAKIIEVEDYTLHIPEYKKNGEWNVWGCEFTKANEDFLPIKTYKNFGDEMKTGVKEEFKVDPITPVIEYLGALRKGQQVWIQILIRQNVKKYKGKKSGKMLNYNDAAAEYLDYILEPYTKYQAKMAKDDEVNYAKQVFGPVDHMKASVAAIADGRAKLHFDCGIRLVALGDKRFCDEDQFNNLRRDVRLLFRQYSQPSVNEFSRINSTQFDAPWSDPTGLALHKIKRRMLDFYRMRIFFHPPIQYSVDYPEILSIFFPSNKPRIFAMGVDEIATIFHFPGMVAETPSFKRLESKIAKPPSNLPL